MITCDEFTAELVGNDSTGPTIEMRVTHRQKDVPPRIYRFPAVDVHDAYRDERGFLDVKTFCAEVVFHDAGCDEW